MMCMTLKNRMMCMTLNKIEWCEWHKKDRMMCMTLKKIDEKRHNWQK